MMEPIKISHSEIAMFKQCRRRWYLMHYRNLEPLTQTYTGPLALGSRFHLALEQYYSPKTYGNKGLALAVLQSSAEEDREKLGQDEYADLAKFDKETKLCRVMVEGYFEWVEETGADASLQIIEAEAEIEAPIEIGSQPIILMGKRDTIAYDEVWDANCLIDHKTCQSLDDPIMDINEQSRMYLLLQRLVGSTPIQRCIWNKARKVLRTGTAKPPFYEREDINVTEQELRYFFERLMGEISDILDVRAKLDQGQSHRSVCYPTPDRSCNYKCEFRAVCPMLDADPHFESFLANNYKAGDPYERYKSEKTGSME